MIYKYCMSKKELSDRFEKYLAEKYPEAKCSLDYKNPFQLLTATILSAQCTDKRVNIVTKELFKKYPAPMDMANADYDEMCEVIKSTGIYKNKAKSLISMAKDLTQKHGGIVPDSLKELTALAGVGRKTANVVLGNIYNMPGIVVDTHVKRIMNRLGLTDSGDPVKIEKELEVLVDGENHCMWGHRVISFGRDICTAKQPKCAICGVKDVCRYYASL